MNDTPIPAGPQAPGYPTIEQIRGEAYPLSTDPDTKKVEYVNELRRQQEADALERFRVAAHNLLQQSGRQHIGWHKGKRSWEDLPLGDGDIRVTMNYIIVAVRARVHRLVSSEIHWRGIPEDNSRAARDRVKVAENFLRARWMLTDMEGKCRQAHLQAASTGLVALKSFWNPNVGPLQPATMFFTQPVTDEFGQPVGEEQVESFVDANGQPVATPDEAFHFRPGDVDTALRTVFNITLNPEATGWTEAEGLRWLIDEEIVPLEVAKERYPMVAHQIRPLDQPASALTFERIARGASQKKPYQQGIVTPYSHGTKQTDPARLTYIREYWELPSAFFPRGRTIAVVGGAIAYDGPFPQGVFPYAPIFGEPAPLNPYGGRPVDHLTSPQATINREWTAVVKEGVAAGTGQFVAWDIPGVPDQISRDDNKVIRVPVRTVLANRSIKDVFARMDPHTVSPDRWHAIEQAKMCFFDIAAYHEVSRGQIPPGLDSGVAIQYLLESEGAQFKDAVDAYKRALIQWGRQQLAIARWGYTDQKRWIPVRRPDLEVMIEGVAGTDLPDPDTIQLDIEYFRPQSEAATRAEIKELAAIGWVPPRKAMEVLDLGGTVEDAFAGESRHYAKAKRENLAFIRGEYVEMPMAGPDGMPMVDMTTGQPVLSCYHLPEEGLDPALSIDPSALEPFFLPDDDDHLVHIDSHLEVLLDRSLPWQVRQKVMAHLALHRMQLAQQIMLEQQMNAAATGGMGAGEAEPASGGEGGQE